MTVEVKIGFQNVARELAAEIDATPADLQARLTDALSAETPLVLTDVKGQVIIVDPEKVAYFQCGAETGRKVGFNL